MMNCAFFVKKGMRSTLSAVVFPLLLVFTLLGSQAIFLQHDHEGEIEHQLDCSICVKKTADSDFLIAVATVQVEAVISVVLGNSVFAVVSNAPLSVKSRSPPLS